MDGSSWNSSNLNVNNILYAVSTVLPVKKPKRFTRKLGIDPATPILLLDQIHYDVSNKPIFRSYDYYRTDIFEFNIVETHEVEP